MEEKDDEIIIHKKTKRRIINFTLFVILILILLLIHSCMNFDKVNDLTPTGNTDIFNIIIGDNNRSIGKCETEQPTCTCKEIEISKDIPTKPVDPIIEPEKEIGALIEDAENGKYDNTTKLNIFSNPYYEYKNIIAPTSTNTYQFIVKNTNDFNIKYDVMMTEDNKYDINMKYRLKLDGQYVKGDKNTWVTYEDLQLEGIKLAGNSQNVYQLEWKWFESDNDTSIGEIDADYTLKISFSGVEI